MQRPNSEIAEALASINEANALLVDGELKRAEKIYAQALKTMEENPQENAWALMGCLQSLADIHFSMQQYDRALREYRRLYALGERTLGEDHADVIDVLFKMEQTMERIATTSIDPSHAAKQAIEGQNLSDRFVQVRRVAESSNPRLSGRFARLDPGSITPKSSSSQTNLPAASLRESSKAERRKSGLLRQFERPVFGIVAKDVFVTLGVLFVGVCGLLIYDRFAKDTAAVKQLLPPARYDSVHEFRSADGSLVIGMGDNRVADLTIAGQTFHRPLLAVSNLTGCIVAFFIATGGGEYWFQRTASGITGQDGSSLFRTGVGELKTADEMRQVAQAATQWFASHGAYPTEVGNLGSTAKYVNSVSGHTQNIHLTCLNYPNSMLADYVSLGLRAKGEDHMQPGEINCVGVTVKSTSEKGQYFFVKGAASDGNLIPGLQAGAPFIIKLENGTQRLPANSHQIAAILAAPIFGQDNLPSAVSFAFLRYRAPIFLLLVAAAAGLVWSLSPARGSLIQQTVHFAAWLGLCITLVLSVFKALRIYLM